MCRYLQIHGSGPTPTDCDSVAFGRGSPACGLLPCSQCDSGTHLELRTLGMNVIKITEMDYISFLRQYGILDFA